jgi:pSer/pThr/pTyr-binding forkhead associated (FHA) protein
VLPDLERRGDEWFLTDVSSKNGTFVRAERIDRETKLLGPTIIQFGNVQAMFVPRRNA